MTTLYKSVLQNFLRIVFVCALTSNLSAAQPLPRATPEDQGVSSEDLQKFVQALNQLDAIHGLVVVRHGQVIAEGWWSPYSASQQHVLYSLSKSFTSTAVGLAISEGRMSLDDTILKYFPADAPADVSANLKAMRVRDLLIMSTGHVDEPTTKPDKMCPKSFLAQPVPFLPGTHFKYNSAATFMLSAIVQKVTGQTVLDYLRPRLFEPLGIEHPVWGTNFQGINLGGYGLRVHTEDIARFGQLYLQHGEWQGKQLIPSNWVAMATSRQTSNGSDPNSDWNQGYGYQFWRCRHNCFRGDGAFGQYCIVMPDQDAVVAINSGIKDLQSVLNVVWDYLLPAMQDHALPPNPAAVQQLQQQLSQLVVVPAQGAPISAQTDQWLNRTFVFSTNVQKLESLSLVSADAGKTLQVTFRLDGKDFMLPCGYREWKSGRGPLFADKLAIFADEPISGTFACPAGDTLALKFCASETPYHRFFTLKFHDNQLTLDSENNVSFDSAKYPQLVGQASPKN